MTLPAAAKEPVAEIEACQDKLKCSFYQFALRSSAV